MEMRQVASCNVSSCAFNTDNLCRTPGINVGPHAQCDTFNYWNNKAGFREVKGGVGACRAADCQYNNMLECNAPNINVTVHSGHADCKTFRAK